MNRQDDYDHDTFYGRYKGYDNDDTNYHSARNLTNEFERHYHHDSGHRMDDRRHNPREHSYHEGDMGNAYERMSREGRGNYQSINWERNPSYDNSRSSYHSQDYRHDYDDSDWRKRSRHREYDNNAYNHPHGSRREEQYYQPRSQRDDRRDSYESNAHYRWSNPDRERYEVNRYY